MNSGSPPVHGRFQFRRRPYEARTVSYTGLRMKPMNNPQTSDVADRF